MSALLLHAAPALCLWLVLTTAWTGAVYAASRWGGRGRSDFARVSLAWLVLMIAPPLVAPLFVTAPTPALPAQVDLALVLSEVTAPLQREMQGLSALDGVALAIAGLFVCGVVWGVCDIARAMRRAYRIAREACPASAADLPLSEIDARVRITERDAPAFCLGGSRPVMVLSRRMVETMNPAQVRMVLRHELAHLERGDPALFFGLNCIDVVFWFSPFVRALTDKVRLSAEIACDAAALNASDVERKAYAHALVSALDFGGEDSARAFAAFGGRSEIPRIRLQHILRGFGAGPVRVTPWPILVCVLALSVGATAAAASTARLATFGDSVMIAALSERVAVLYGAPVCAPDDGSPTQLTGHLSTGRVE